MIHEKINVDWVAAMKAKSPTKTVLASLKADLSSVAKKTNLSILSDSEAITVLRKSAATAQESLDFATQAGRSDLVAQHQAALEVISTYIPSEPGLAEVKTLMVQAATEANLGFTKENMGFLIRSVTVQSDGRISGKLAKEAFTALQEGQ
jgi:uncharacterized protein YqeY